MANLYYKKGSDWLPLGGGSLPVGTYVYSDNNVSPAADMGGTWQSLGYTAVEPVVLKTSYTSNNNADSEERVFYLIQYYNYIIGYIQNIDYSIPRSFEGVLPLSNIYIYNDYGMVKSQNWYYGMGVVGNITTNPSGTDGSKYPRVNQNSGGYVCYTTDEVLPTSVSGGKYLFKRTA